MLMMLEVYDLGWMDGWNAEHKSNKYAREWLCSLPGRSVVWCVALRLRAGEWRQWREGGQAEKWRHSAYWQNLSLTMLNDGDGRISHSIDLTAIIRVPMRMLRHVTDILSFSFSFMTLPGWSCFRVNRATSTHTLTEQHKLLNLFSARMMSTLKLSLKSSHSRSILGSTTWWKVRMRILANTPCTKWRDWRPARPVR